MKQAVDFLYDLPKFTKKNSPGHTKQLMRLLGSPCLGRKVIHIAGSNGKGSVSCFLYHMLLAGEKSAALFTSPHLVDIRERFQVNGEMVGGQAFLAAYKKVRDASGELVQKTGSHPTFFEFLFAMGMVIFEQADAEYIVLETGLGGRLDATNSFPTPIMTVITSISLEHTEYLGDTLGKIAWEKAGILKPGVPLVFSAGNPEAETVIRARAEELGCPCTAIYPEMFRICEIKENDIDFFLWNDYHGKAQWRIPFSAPYQAENASLAITAMQMLGSADADGGRSGFISDDTIQRGLLNTRWPGRMQQVFPGVYLDGAHNPSGIGVFLDSVRALTKDDALPPMLLFSMVRDKDVRASVSLLSGIEWDRIAVTAIPDERGTPSVELAQIFASIAGQAVVSYEDYREAWQDMLRKKKDGQKLFGTGSLYFVGALLQLIN